MFPLVIRWNHGWSYVGLPEVLENIRLLLDQWSKVEVETTNSAATVRPEGTAQGGHVGEGQHQLVGAARGVHQGVGSYDAIHTHFQKNFSANTVTIDNYLAWFRAVGILIQLTNHVFYSQTPPHYGPPPHMVSSFILTGTYFAPLTSPAYYTPAQMSMLNPISKQSSMYPPPLMQVHMQQSMALSIPSTFPTYLGFGAPYGFTPIMTQTPRASLFYRGGSSSRPMVKGVVDTLWKARTTQ
ncbi:hypothetical protein PVK06_020487 [Gossypium arboreum]|uniref:Uncharacterized protein n=1 Tax=Gossypium arboreum TaxID=29729 RepID=A0ABR0PMH2_GOSAR|nr:hypothetical protein PVK06_020487 [Gossypium arboreum]